MIRARGARWRGFGGLFSLAVIVGPWAVLEGPVPSVLDGDSLVPLGVVVVLIIAVFRAGQQMQKLSGKMDSLDKLERRLLRIERHLGIAEDAGL